MAGGDGGRDRRLVSVRVACSVGVHGGGWV